VAVLLPDALRARLAAEIGRLRGVASDVAWVAETNLHVTLKFLGRIEDARVDLIVEALGAVAARTPAFDLGVRGLGAFPTPGRPRVVWVGLEPAAPLAALAGDLDGALAALGFARETRSFAAHVTLGRVRETRRNPALAAALAGPADCGRLSVSRLSLMRSELHPRGARYTELASVVLSGAGSPVK
jgi:2'-5' RNA ligase